MKIYRIPLADYIACVANIAFAVGKYLTFSKKIYYLMEYYEKIIICSSHFCDTYLLRR